ncbi:MAG: hypothetical protein KTR28_07820 [Micavibrio sp.]|nr:hypothetical protein [Micavibrio sp.]
MNKRAAYLLQMIDKIGSPLLRAVKEVSAQSGEADMKRDAQMMAAMLGKTVQASIELGNVMEVNPAEEGDDSLRVALAALAAPLMAGQLEKKKNIPDDADIKRIVASLQPVLTFSDNFTPTDSNIERMEKASADGGVVDINQSHIQYVRAFVPVAQALSKFSFGQNEQKLVIEITKRLTERAQTMRETLAPGLSGDEAKRIELGLLPAIAQIYADAHEREIIKGGEAPSLDAVWAAFDMQVAFVEALSDSVMPAGGASVPAPQETAPVQDLSQAPIQQEASSAQPQQTAPPPIFQAQPQQTAPQQAPPSQPEQQQASGQAAGGNPMSMFANKPADTPEAPPMQQQQAPPAQGQAAGGNPMSMFASKPQDPALPAAAPQPQAHPPPAQEQPQVFTPPPQAQNTGDESEEGGDTGGDPMSFFKKGE